MTPCDFREIIHEKELEIPQEEATAPSRAEIPALQRKPPPRVSSLSPPYSEKILLGNDSVASLENRH